MVAASIAALGACKMIPGETGLSTASSSPAAVGSRRYLRKSAPPPDLPSSIGAETLVDQELRCWITTARQARHLCGSGNACARRERPAGPHRSISHQPALSTSGPGSFTDVTREACGWSSLQGACHAEYDMRQALDCFARSARLAPDRPHVQLRLAEFLLEQGDLTGARLAIERSLSVAPEDPHAHLSDDRRAVTRFNA